MNLDDLESFRARDPGDMLAWIDAVPQQIEDAWRAAEGLDVPESLAAVERIVVAGMGGSAMGAGLVQALAAHESPAPFEVVRDYRLPAHTRGPRTLVIASSYSGNTEETLAAFAQAGEQGTQRLVLAGGGELVARARAEGVPSVLLPVPEPAPQPRAMVVYSCVLLLGLLCRLGLLADKRADVEESAEVLRARWSEIRAATPAVRNPAKRLAGQLVGRIPVVFGADVLAPVAQRWKGQLNENAKSWAGFDVLPELNHNTVAGILFPQELMTKVAVILLTTHLYPQRIQRRFDVTRQLFMEQGLAVDVIKARGESLLAAMLSALHFGDYVSYYLAMAYDVDPTPIPPIQELKEQLARG
jgi:glucose/mannose-6-phosphate isomerase